MSYHDTDWSLVDFDEPKKPAPQPEKAELKRGKPSDKGNGNGDRSSAR